MPEAEQLLRSAYRAFNARDIEAAIELMHPEVDWPNAWEGGRVPGRAAVRAYWTRQFAAISSKVEPEGFTEEADGDITVDVHQVVHDADTGERISDSRVLHRYRLEDGLIVRIDVLERRTSSRGSRPHPAPSRESDPRARSSREAGAAVSPLPTCSDQGLGRVVVALVDDRGALPGCAVQEGVASEPVVPSVMKSSGSRLNST